jgi:transposase
VNKQWVSRQNKGKAVIMDNVNFDKVIGVKEAIEANGIQLIFLPPYSPDLSPIKNMWSKIKSILRKSAPITKSQFRKVIRNAFIAI